MSAACTLADAIHWQQRAALTTHAARAVFGWEWWQRHAIKGIRQKAPDVSARASCRVGMMVISSIKEDPHANWVA